MLIIVEGPDGTGKTTLVIRLRNELAGRAGSVEVLHRGVPTSHPLDEYERPLWDYRPGTGRHAVCDRWHLGEDVYPRVTGRPTRLDDAVRLHLELFLRSRGALVVLAGGVDSYVREALAESNPAGVPDGAAPELHSLFLAAQRRSHQPAWYVWNRDWDGELVRGVLGDAADEEERAASLAPFTTYVGPARPDVLVLGDVRNGDAVADQGPAFAPYPGTSGHFLFRALAASYDDRRFGVGVANACDVDDPGDLWEALGRPPVVSLGTQARRRVHRFGIWPHATLPHPQYVRRFQHRRVGEYGATIYESTGRDLVDSVRWDLEEGWPSASRRLYQDRLTLPEV